MHSGSLSQKDSLVNATMQGRLLIGSWLFQYSLCVLLVLKVSQHLGIYLRTDVLHTA